MPLRALKIVKEELAEFRKGLTTPDPYVHGYLDGLEARITERIEKECIEQPDPADLDFSKVAEELGVRKLFGGTL